MIRLLLSVELAPRTVPAATCVSPTTYPRRGHSAVCVRIARTE